MNTLDNENSGELQSPLESGEVRIPLGMGNQELEGDWGIRTDVPRAVILFAHGSGSNRNSERHIPVAEKLHERGFATLRFNLLTRDEQQQDEKERNEVVTDQVTDGNPKKNPQNLRHDIRQYIARLIDATNWLVEDWLARNPKTANLSIGYYGASTGAGVAVRAAASRSRNRAYKKVRAVVSRGGRLDLVEPMLLGTIRYRLLPPTLLIIGEKDITVRGLNLEIAEQLRAEERKIVTVPGATHLFEEGDAMYEVARLTVNWFMRHLVRDPARR